MTRARERRNAAAWWRRSSSAAAREAKIRIASTSSSPARMGRASITAMWPRCVPSAARRQIAR